MDLIQVTYKSRMALFYDSPGTLVDGQWHLCPPGAVVYPGWHAFGSQIWDPDALQGDAPAIGEQPGKLGFVQSFPTPGYSGQRWCGSASVWEHGDSIANQGSLPLDGRGRPICCGAVDPGMVRVGGNGFLPPRELWFFRADRRPPQSVVPGVFVGQWDNTGAPTVAGMLDVVPGQVVQSTPFSHLGIALGTYHVGVVQYLSAPLVGQTFNTSVQWRLGYGYSLSVVSHIEVDVDLQVFLMDGATGAVKAVLLAEFIGNTHVAPALSRGVARNDTFQTVSAADGDYLCAEIGVHYQTLPPGAPRNLVMAVQDSGTTPILDGETFNASPLALLAYPATVEDLDVPSTGSLIPFAGGVVPGGYLVCDGSAYLAATYPDLFALLGTSWGSGGAGTFRVPDLRDRTVIGTSPGGLGPDRPTVRALTATGGEEQHQLVTAELASHTHPIADPGHSHAAADGFSFITNDVVTTLAFGPNYGVDTPSLDTALGATGISLGNAGADTPHNNMQPFGVVQWLIKT